jgi:hypothetical protein
MEIHVGIGKSTPSPSPALDSVEEPFCDQDVKDL